METDSELESDEEEDEEEEEQAETDDTRVVHDQKDMESLQVEVGSSSGDKVVEEPMEVVQAAEEPPVAEESKVETQGEIEVETENQETPDEDLEKLIKTHSIEDQQDQSFIQSDTNNPEVQDSKQLSGVSGPAQNELLGEEMPNPDELSKLIEMKMTFQKRLEELDTMTRDMQQIYHKLNKNKQ